MDQKDSNLSSPQIPVDPVTEPSELADLSPNTTVSPVGTNSFTPTDPNLKPLESVQPTPTINPGTETQNQNNLPMQQPEITPPNEYKPTPAQPEIFVNPNPPPQPPTNFENQIPTNAPVGDSTPSDNMQLPNENRFHALPLNKGILISVIAIILVIGIGGFVLNEFIINRITSLKLLSQDAQFYLALSVKKNPQAQKAKTTIKKFPGGDRMLKQFDKYYTNFTGSDPKNPLNDITQYAETELFLARASRTESTKDYSNRLITIVDLKSSKEASENITNFEDDKTTYKVATQDYKGNKIYTIKLVSEQKLYEQSLGRTKNIYSSFSTPKPQSIYATNIDKYIVASDKANDVKSSIELSQTKTIFGFSASDAPKSILDAKDHQQVSKFFAKDTFLKYFQREPITPYNIALPFNSSSISTYPNGAETETKTYQKIARGLDATFVDDGLKVNTYSQEYPLENITSTDTFKIDQVLASKLPKKYSGVAPTLYAETRNIKGQWQKQLKIAESLKDSKNRNQRKDFEDYLDNIEKMKKSYKNAYGIDYESDILSWLDGQVSFIFNAGKNKKGPEFILVAQTSSQDKAEKAFKNFRIPDYTIERRDATRKSDLSSLNYTLRNYYYDKLSYPDSLDTLVTSKSYYNYTYLTKLPKDPKTGANYNYVLSSDKKSYTLSATLENSQTITYTNKSTVAQINGEAKDTKLSATASNYKNAKIYSIKVFEYKDIKYYLFGAVTKNKAIIAISDGDKSLKEIVDFEGNPSDSLVQNSAWKKQFGKVKDPLVSIAFVEPVNAWGFMEYLKNAYPEYKETLESYSPDAKKYWDDLEKAVKGYLNTVPSVGSIEFAKNNVTITQTFVNIKELSSKDKKEAEDALGRLLKTDETNQYKSVLGINSETANDKAKAEWDKFYQNNLKPIIDPQRVLSN